MRQRANPVSDVYDLGWSPQPVAPSVNQAANGAGATTPASPTGNTFVVRMAGLAWPGPGPQNLGFGVGKSDGGATAAVQVSLMQGDAVIATRSEQPTPGGTTGYSFQLSDEEVAQISDYSNLRVRVSVGSPLVVGCGQFPNGAASQFAFTPSGIGNGGCNDCANLNAPTTITYQSGCTWNGAATICGALRPSVWSFAYDSFAGLWKLNFSTGEAVWTAAGAGWDGRSPLALTLSSSFVGNCSNYPNQITIAPA